MFIESNDASFSCKKHPPPFTTQGRGAIERRSGKINLELLLISPEMRAKPEMLDSNKSDHKIKSNWVNGCTVKVITRRRRGTSLRISFLVDCKATPPFEHFKVESCFNFELCFEL